MFEPRKTTSNPKKSSPVPRDLCDLIEKVFVQSFSEELGSSSFRAEGRIFSEEIVLRVGLYEKGAIRPINFDASVDFAAGEDNATEKIHFCVDAIDAMVRQYFEAEGDIEMPREWTEFEIEGESEIYLRTNTLNANLEAQANELLGEEFLDNDNDIEAAMEELFNKPGGKAEDLH